MICRFKNQSANFVKLSAIIAGCFICPPGVAGLLSTPVAIYLEAALEDGDPSLVIAVLGDIARSQSMRNMASETGLGSEHLYKDLLSESNLEFTTVIKILQALGLRFQIVPIV